MKSEKLGKIDELVESRNIEAALELADELVDENPHEPEAWAKRAFVNAMQVRHSDAIHDISQAISLSNSEPEYFYFRGRQYLAAKDYNRAISDFTRTLELCESWDSEYYKEPAHFMRAEAYVKLKRYDDARNDCRHISDDFVVFIDSPRSKKDILDECNGF